MKQLRIFLLLLIAITTMPGCGVGYNSLLFVTKSNVGLDFDAKPPTAELAISRVEGVVEPVFEDGKTLPVMASFRTSGSGLFAGEIGQTFTTGDAALVMALLYGDKDYEFKPGDNDWEEKVAGPFNSSLDVKLKSTEIERFTEKSVRPVFFGTSTSFGAKLSWSGMTAAFPDSLHVGYRRKELAWAPIAYSMTKKKVSVPSLLATIDIEGEATSPQNSQLKWLQYFATGKAATALALRQDVRRAMIKRLDPNVEFGANQTLLGREYGVAMLQLVYQFIEEQVSLGDSEAINLQQQLNVLGHMPPASFTRYTWSPSISPKVLGKALWSGPANRDFKYCTSYWINLSASVKSLAAAVKAIDGTPPVVFRIQLGIGPVAANDATDAEKQDVRDALFAQREAFRKFDRAFRQSPAILEAAQYMQNLLR